MTQDRGIRMALTYRSWQLILEALTYLVEKPHLDDLEQYREEMGKVLRYIRKNLGKTGLRIDTKL